MLFLRRILLALALGLSPALLSAVDRDERIAELNQLYAKNLAVVQYPDGGASAFIAKIGNGKYLITNQHVMAGLLKPTFTEPGGAPLQVGDAAAAVDHDIMAFGINHEGPGIEMMYEIEKNASVGDEVAVLGNPSAFGVIRPLSGKILGFGPNLIEISVPIVGGNSGSPIIHLKTGKVIGVVSHMLRMVDTGEEGNAALKVRRFGYRLDSIKQWEPVRWDYFVDDFQSVNKVKIRTDQLIQFLNSLRAKQPMNPELYGDPTVQRSLRKFQQAVQANQANQGAAAEPDSSGKLTAALLEELQTAAREDVAWARRRIVYGFFKKQLDAEEQRRNSVSEILAGILKSRPKL
jgi:hypothetical protein